MYAGHRLDCHRVELSVPGRPHGHAGGSLAARLRELSGVSKVTVNPLTERAVVLFDPAAIGIDGILHALEPQKLDIDRTLARWHFPVAGLACARCARRVEEAVGRLPGVRGAIVNRATGSLTVEFIVDRTDLDAVRAALLAQGFDPGPDLHPRSATAERAHADDS